MKQYLEIVDNILTYGQWKENRTGIRTKTLPFIHFRHNMSDGFPLLTTKKMAMKSILVELEGFLKGITDKSWYQSNGCKIWNEWASPHTVKDRLLDMCRQKENQHLSPKELLEKAQLEENDLGPIYGFEGRHFGAIYRPGVKPEGGIDQLQKLLDTLLYNPNDRRMVVSYWNPHNISKTALPPCHFAWTVVVIDGTINLGWKQRSCDMMLGAPFDIAHYATLLLILAQYAGFKPGILSGLFDDCHIYENHLEMADYQLTREPNLLPTASIPTKCSPINWHHTNFELANYTYHPSIKYEIAI